MNNCCHSSAICLPPSFFYCNLIVLLLLTFSGSKRSNEREEFPEIDLIVKRVEQTRRSNGGKCCHDNCRVIPLEGSVEKGILLNLLIVRGQSWISSCNSCIGYEEHYLQSNLNHSDWCGPYVCENACLVILAQSRLESFWSAPISGPQSLSEKIKRLHYPFQLHCMDNKEKTSQLSSWSTVDLCLYDFTLCASQKHHLQAPVMFSLNHSEPPPPLSQPQTQRSYK